MLNNFISDWSYNKNIFKDKSTKSIIELCDSDPDEFGYGVLLFFKIRNNLSFLILKNKTGFVLVKVKEGLTRGPVLQGDTLLNTLFKSELYLKDNGFS